MQSISLADELTLQAAPDPDASGDVVVCPGLGDPPPPAENLAAAALAAFRAATGWDAPPLQLHIVKRVPVAAGLGGGSGDAAAALRLAAAASGLGDSGLLPSSPAPSAPTCPPRCGPGGGWPAGPGSSCRRCPIPIVPLGVLVLPVARALSTGDVYAQADRMGLARDGGTRGCRRALAGALADGSPLPPAELLRNDLQGAARRALPRDRRRPARGPRDGRRRGAGERLRARPCWGCSPGPAAPLARALPRRALAERVPAPLAADAIAARCPVATRRCSAGLRRTPAP